MNRDSRVLFHAVCDKKRKHFLISSDDGHTVTDFLDIPEEEAKGLSLSGWKSLEVVDALRRCPWCGTRKIGSCTCQMDHDCPDTADYRYPCLFCKNLHSACGKAGKDINALRFSVTSPQFDDIGAVLNSMQFIPRSFSEVGFDCDILFLNCGSVDYVDPDKLREYVRNGGCVYASDWAADVLKTAFPRCASFAKKGASGEMTATILDEEIRALTGKTIKVTFDLGSWMEISNPIGTVLIRSEQFPPKPLMFTFKEGEGQVFYTSFHNHAQASDAERALLQVMVARQIGSVTSMSAEEVLQRLNININLTR